VYDAFARLNAFEPAWVVEKVDAATTTGTIIFENRSGDRLCFKLEQIDGLA
jgi:hypothetical protein